MSSEIHDLGHDAYVGPRTPTAHRFWVVARNTFAVAWKSRWGVKLPVVIATGTTFTAAVVMYFLRLRLTDSVRARGAPIPQAEAIVFIAGAFYEFSAFILAVLVGCAAVANDLRMGAFQFYFSRALRPRDYVTGKLLGMGMVIGIPMLLGPLVLAALRLVYAESPAQAWELAPVLPRALAHGLLGTLAYVLPAVGLGALAGRRQPAQALFVVYFMLVVPAVFILSEPLGIPAVRALSLPNDLSVLGEAIFGLERNPADPPAWVSALSLATFSALGLAAVWRRVSRVETAGLGSG
jgi:hypothetical protein